MSENLELFTDEEINESIERLIEEGLIERIKHPFDSSLDTYKIKQKN